MLENDLVYVEGRRPVPSRLLSPGRGAPVGTDLAERPGRYRVHVRAAHREARNQSLLVLQAWVPQESGGDFEATAHGVINIPVAAISMSGHTFKVPAQWQDFTLEFDVERGKPVMVGLCIWAEPIATPERFRSRRHRWSWRRWTFPSPSVGPDQTRCATSMGSQGRLEVRLVNATGALEEAQICLVIVDDEGKAIYACRSSSR